MKTILIILFLCVLPMVLLGTNLNRQSYTNDPTLKMLSPDGDNFLSNPDGKLSLPIMPVSRDRNRRLSQILHQSDTDQNNVFQIDGQETIYYNLINPSQVDSLVYCLYDSTAFTYVPLKSRKYYYASNGVDITRIDLRYAQNPPGYVQKVFYEYDDQHRLIHQYQYAWGYPNINQNLITRYHWIIVNDLITERYIAYFSNSTQPTSYLRIVFLRDSQGRNIGFLGTASPDSLNWINDSDGSSTFDPNDTSTGLNQINYYSSAYVTDFYNSMGSYYSYNMISEFVGRIWTPYGWRFTNKMEYTYNNYGQLGYLTLYNNTNGWIEDEMLNCNYDLNGNLSQFSSQDWDVINNNWSGYVKIHTLTWEEYTDIDDEVAPEIALGVSAYPNPFQNIITIHLQNKLSTAFHASIYNIKGQLVKLFNTQEGTSLVWDSKDNAGNPVG